MEEQGKICTKCGKWKFLEEYNKRKASKDGKQLVCRECQKEYKKQWKENNKEHEKEYAKQWREGNKEYRKEYSKQWKENNPEYYKQHYQNNKECYKEQNKQWRENNKEHIKQYRENNKEHTKRYREQYYQNNKEHIKEHQKQYRENNKGHIKEYDKQYRQNIKQNNLQRISVVVEQINPIFKQLNLPIYGYIYLFTNIKTKRCYVGQTTQSLKVRYETEIIQGWIKHRKSFKNQKFKDELIEDDIQVTEVLDVAFCQYHLDKLESWYIDKYDSCNNGYNNYAGNHNTDDGIEEFNQILKENGLQFIDGKLVKIA